MSQPVGNGKEISREEKVLWVALCLVGWTFPLLVFTRAPGAAVLGFGAPIIIWTLALFRLSGRLRMVPILSLSTIGVAAAVLILYIILGMLSLFTTVEEKHGYDRALLSSGNRMID